MKRNKNSTNQEEDKRKKLKLEMKNEVDIDENENENKYLGQIVPIDNKSCLTSLELQKIKCILEKTTNKFAHVYVPSGNQLKVNSAIFGIKSMIKELLNLDEITFNQQWKISSYGIECESGVDEQPHGIENTQLGAKTRLENLKRKSPKIDPEEINFFISMENGLILEHFPDIVKNPNRDLFDVGDKKVWVDRCIIQCEIEFPDHSRFKSFSISDGVTTPKEEVTEAEKSKWTKTAGSFIGLKYKCNPKDWHGLISGKSREYFMQNAIKTCLGLPLCFLAPVKDSKFIFKPDVFHDYLSQPINFFTSKDIDSILTKERISTELKENDKEDIKMWRGIFSTIPQSSKKGADNINDQNCLGVIITEDLLTLYFDKINGEDVLHVILVWAKEDQEYKDKGWTVPGKRDRAYSQQTPDISVEDANYSLVETVLNLKRTDIAYHFILGYFDDRIREQRMRSSGFFSTILLNSKPQFNERMIGIPMNIFISLIKREIKIPHPTSLQGESFPMVRNHDSLLLNILETTKFYTLMENLKYVQSQYNKLSSNNGQLIKRPPFPEINPGHECDVCTDLLVNCKIICKNGHTLCGACSDKIDKCPTCRASILNPKIPNLGLEHIILTNYPKQYKIRHQQLTGTLPHTWENDPMFNGKYIQLK